MSEEDYRAPEEVTPHVEEAVEATQDEQPLEVEHIEPVPPTPEDIAATQGWRPPGEFDEPDKEAIGAEEFLRRGELFDKIKDLKSRYENDTYHLKGQVKELGDMMKDERRRGYDQALVDLEHRRDEAVEIGDVDAFKNIDQEYNRVRDERSEIDAPPVQQQAQEVPKEVKDFQARNADWFNQSNHENSTMSNQASAMYDNLIQSKPHLFEQQRIDLVEAEIKSLYPHRFSNPKKQQPATVESASVVAPVAPGSKGSSMKYSDLTENQKAICEQFLSLDPSVTVDDYLVSLETGLQVRR